MKKLFSRFERIDQGAAREANNFVGKVFTVGRHTVTVEDVIAEGESRLLFSTHPHFLAAQICVSPVLNETFVCLSICFVPGK